MRIGTAVLAISLSVMLVSPALAQETAPPPPEPKKAMTPEEHDAFLEEYLDVFARGTIHLNETPGDYFFDHDLEINLTADLISSLKNESAEMREAFDPFFAGPLLGISPPDNPLVGFDGENVTQETIDDVYAGFLGALIFDREEFFDYLEEMVQEMVPDQPVEDIDNSQPNATMMRNLVMEELLASPIAHWANDLPEIIVPDEFVAPQPEALRATPPLARPANLTRAIAASPFAAASPDDWAKPGFHLSLASLLDFLTSLTALPPLDLLRLLGLLGETRGHAVSAIRGPLSAFPALAAQVNDIDAATLEAQSALVDLVAPEVAGLGGRVDLPSAVVEVLDEASALAASATLYAARLNGASVNGTWDVPALVDLDGDGLPEASIRLSHVASQVAAADGLVAVKPKLEVQRLTSVYAVLDEAGVGPSSDPFALDVQVGFVHPVTGELVAFDASIAGGADHLEATLASLDPALDVATVNGFGEYRFTAIVVDDEATRAITLTAPSPPASATGRAVVDPASGAADASVAQLVRAPLALEAVSFGPDGRLALRVSGEALPATDVETHGEDFRVEAPEGATVTIERQESIDGSAERFVQRVVTITTSSETTTLELGDRLRLLAGKTGADFAMSVATVEDGAYSEGAWAEVTDGGRTVTIEPGKLVFESEIPIGRIRVTVAQSRLAALNGLLENGLLLVDDDLTAFAIENVKKMSVAPRTGDDYRIDVASAISQPFYMAIESGDDSKRFLLSNLPLRTLVDVTDDGASVGSSGFISSVVGNLTRHFDGAGADPTRTVFALQGVSGTSAFGLDDATVNLFLGGGVGSVDILSSNVLADGEYLFEALEGNHALGDVVGELRQHSAKLLNATGDLFGGIFGTPGSITIELLIDGALCQSFGKDDTRIELCLSNVPEHVDIEFELLPEPLIAYNASEVIHEVRLSFFAPEIEAALVIKELPARIELRLAPGAAELTMSSRLAAILLTARLRDVTIAAGIEDLPAHVRFEWTEGGLDPVFDPDERIGRVFLFVSTPDFSFLVDIVDIPLLTVEWDEGALRVNIPEGRRIGSAKVQLVVANLTFLLEAQGIPGIAATWNEEGGTLATNGPLDLLHTELLVGTDLSLLVTVKGVPPVSASWSDAGAAFALEGGGKIEQIKLQFLVRELLVFAQADGVPTITLARSEDGFNLSAPTGIDSLAVILAIGPGYFNPFGRETDFVGLYMRPDDADFGLSARVTGIEGVLFFEDPTTKKQELTLQFTQDKDVRILVNLLSSVFILLADALVSNLAAKTTMVFTPDDVEMRGEPLDPERPNPWLQARLYAGTPAAYAELLDPRWAFESAGLNHGITANTLVDAATGGLATKWKVFAPLPDILTFGKQTEDGVPSVQAETDVGIGKLDLRTMLRTRILGFGDLNTLVVLTVTNIPAGFTLAQSLGTETDAGSPSVALSAGAPIDEVFLGVRFDNRWYGSRMAEDPEFLDFGIPWVKWHESDDRDLGFPIWFSIGDIPTVVSMDLGKSDWSSAQAPFFHYTASASTLDAALWIDIGILWDTFVKTEILLSSEIGRKVPGWLRGLAKWDATGHLFIQLRDVPAQGILVRADLDSEIIIEVPQCPTIGDPICDVFAERLGKFFLDFNFRIEEIHGKQGCWICTSVIQLGWHWNYGWGLEIARLSFMVKDLKYLSIKPKITSDLYLDGEILFDFKAQIDAFFSAGVSLHIKILKIRFLVFCACIGIEFKFIVAAGFISFQVLEKTWKVNYWTWGWPCGWKHWCHKHLYGGIDYTIPGNWRFDLPIEWPPLIEFRGLHIDSSDDGRGIQHYKVFLDPVVMFCINSYAGILVWSGTQPCFGQHIVPVIFYMAYAYITYFSIDGPHFWSVRHKH